MAYTPKTLMSVGIQTSFRKKRWFKVAFTVTRLTRTTTPEPKIKRYFTADDIFEAREYPSYQITLPFISQNNQIAKKLCKIS